MNRLFAFSGMIVLGFSLLAEVQGSQSAFAAANSFGNTNLQYGSTGQAVHVLQLALQDYGTFPQALSATNFFGPITKQAVESFQNNMGLAADGVVGPKTKQALLQKGYEEYVVAPGDSLWSIGQTNHESTAFLKATNHLQTDALYPGQALLVKSAQSGAASEQTVQTSNASASVSPEVQQVVNLVNQQRAKNGLAPLALNMNLTQMAYDKAKDMRDNQYFDHQSPTYGSPFDMMKQFGISYSYAGENIAAGQTSAQEVMNDWMNSSGHRANILNPKFTEIGVGYVTGGQYGTDWVQEFIKP
ncbi:CAP domain-containing protein [Fodinisporobacter ferrooxydans]